MPSSIAILASLTRSANAFVALAVAWHVLFILVLAAHCGRLLTLTQRRAALLLILPVASVSAVAWWSGSPFNAVLFALLGAGLLTLALRLPAGPLAKGAPWARGLGALGIVYALGYPHFVTVSAGWQYLLLAPLGVAPCASLALLSAGTLLGGFRSRPFGSVAAGAAAFYALLGLVWLGVWLDLGLLVLAAALAVNTWRQSEALPEPGSDGERAAIEAFLALPRIALVGASSQPTHFSRMVMAELCAQGIDVVPIHTDAATIGGRRAFAQLQQVDPPVLGALIMTPAAASAGVVEDCAQAGIARVWLHRGVGPGAVSDAAVRRAGELGLTLVAGRCPLMFLGRAAGVHKLHATLLKLSGRYPHPPASA
jgi:predicted CoA-binding protein